MPIFHEGDLYKGYRVATFIKKNPYNETYRLIDDAGIPYFLKIYNSKPMDDPKVENGAMNEVLAYLRLNNPGIAKFISGGVDTIDGRERIYVITEYFTGSLASEWVDKGETLCFEDAFDVFSDILHALKHMHEEKVTHNDITPRNIIIQRDGGRYVGKIIDLGHAGIIGEKEEINTSDMEPHYRASESFYGTWSTASDLYAACAVFYALLHGKAPWQTEIDEATLRDPKALRKVIHNARKQPLEILPQRVRDWMIPILRKGLAKVDQRFKHINTLIRSLEECQIMEDVEPEEEEVKIDLDINPAAKEKDNALQVNDGEIRVGGGFADVAGMEELKSLLQQKVIFLLKNQEVAKKYRLTPPNGMLLYGPPGCGKTFFAEKFAEESGFNFHFIKASDLGSIYVHGTQGKIAELFKKAEAQAPTIICLDEFDAMAPSRQSTQNENYSGEVNEFLSQLNNCSTRRIFVVATTNQPDKIDKAILRKGRLDLAFFVPAPNEATRRLMFDLNLKDRPCLDVDTAELAQRTENYVSSDIAYIVNDAALIAALRDEPITQTDLLNSISCTRPSLSNDLLAYYNKQMEIFSGKVSDNSGRRQIGYTAAVKK